MNCFKDGFKCKFTCWWGQSINKCKFAFSHEFTSKFLNNHNFDNKLVTKHKFMNKLVNNQLKKRSQWC